MGELGDNKVRAHLNKQTGFSARTAKTNTQTETEKRRGWVIRVGVGGGGGGGDEGRRGKR